jgi:hypothetical protein
MKKTSITFKALVVLTFTFMLAACEKETNLNQTENGQLTETRLRYYQPSCTSVLGSVLDSEVISEGPKRLLKELNMVGLMPSVPQSGSLDWTKWILESKCGGAYLSYSPTGEFFAEAHGFDNYSTEQFSMKIIASGKTGTMVTFSGKSEKEWKIVSIDHSTYKNRIVILIESSSFPGKNSDFALVTLNVLTRFEEVNGYKTAKASLSMLGFSFNS